MASPPCAEVIPRTFTCVTRTATALSAGDGLVLLAVAMVFVAAVAVVVLIGAAAVVGLGLLASSVAWCFRRFGRDAPRARG